jgi:glycerophosphoryl diester phosphodiesterase
VSLSDPILVIGHRGAAGLVPENTLPSFQRAFDCGVGAVELDVYAVEGELIVIHDDTLERTTDGTGPLAERRLAELRRLDAGSGWPIPLLAEVTAALPAGVGLNIELKGPDTAEPVAAFLARHALPDVLVSSFEHDELTRFHALAPDVRVAPLFHKWQDDAWAIAAGLGAWAINLSRKIATTERLQQARALGLRTFVYTVNDLDEARLLIANGATGIFTDFPDRITAAHLAPDPSG